MKKYLNPIIFITGLTIFISNFIIGHLRCTTVGLCIMFLSLLNYQSHKIRLALPKAFLLSVMFWIIRFSLISIPTALHFYDFLATKLTIFLILTIFFLKTFPHHPLKLYKLHVITIFLSTIFMLDLIITYQFDSIFFKESFYYLTLFPIILFQTLSSNNRQTLPNQI